MDERGKVALEVAYTGLTAAKRMRKYAPHGNYSAVEWRLFEALLEVIKCLNATAGAQKIGEA